MKTTLLSFYIKKSILTTEELSEAFPNLNKWLSNEIEPSFEEISTLATALDIPTGLLVVSKPVEHSIPIYNYRINWESIAVLVDEVNHKDIFNDNEYCIDMEAVSVVESLKRKTKLINNIYARLPIPLIHYIKYSNSKREVLQGGWIIEALTSFANSDKFKDLSTKDRKIFNRTCVNYVEYDYDYFEDENEIYELVRRLHYT